MTSRTDHDLAPGLVDQVASLASGATSSVAGHRGNAEPDRGHSASPQCVQDRAGREGTRGSCRGRQTFRTRRASAAARCADRSEGRRRHHRRTHGLRLPWRFPGQDRGLGDDSTPPRRRRSDRGQDQQSGIGPVAAHERFSLRLHAQSVVASPHSRRIVGRHRRGRRRRIGQRRNRFRRCRFHPNPCGLDQPRRNQTAARAHLNLARRRSVLRPDGQRTARSHRRRRGTAARRRCRQP